MCILKQAIAIAITIPLLGLGNAAIAEEAATSTQGSFFGSVFKSKFEKNFSASVGVKAWNHEWQYPQLFVKSKFKLGDNLLEKNNVQLNSKRETVLIPHASVRFMNFLVSASYFPKTDYSFEEVTKLLTADVGGGFAVVAGGSLTAKAEREEWDINFGYYLTPSLVVTLGYKNIDRDYDFLFTNTQNTSQSIALHGSQSTDGLTLGIAGTAPLQGKLALYGSFAFGWLETDHNQIEKGTILEDSRTYDTNYYLSEVGLAYSLPFNQTPVLSAASFYAGYRFQSLDQKDVTSSNDTTQGFVIGANLTF